MAFSFKWIFILSKMNKTKPTDFLVLSFFLAIVSVSFLIHYPTYSQSKNQPIGLVQTPLGDIYIELFDLTPNHQKSFIKLAKMGYWDSLTFNRVIPDFVAQGGCPDTEEGFTDPNYLLKPEFVPGISHIYGAVGAGRDDNPDKLSATCQFYIVQNRNGLHRLDNDYTVFGQIIKGLDVVDKIVQVQKDDLDNPKDPITLKIKIIYLNRKEIGGLKDAAFQLVDWKE